MVLNGSRSVGILDSSEKWKVRDIFHKSEMVNEKAGRLFLHIL